MHETMEDKVSAYLTGVLPRTEKEKFENHLVTCYKCKTNVKLISSLKEGLDKNRTTPPRIDISDKVMQEIYNLTSSLEE